VNNSIQTLKTITDELLAPKIDYTLVRNACATLSVFFYNLTSFDLKTRENQQHISTGAGLAISPCAAAFCITDMMRTRNFLHGIKEAIDTKLNENPSRPITVLYAGTGPFATLLTPLITIYAPSQLQLVLMDINPLSIGYLQKLIQQLDAHSYIIDIVQADALSYIIPEKHQPDIIVSETMKPGLRKEPQVSIVAGLLPQCKRNPILIPGLIKVEACHIGNLLKNPDALIVLQTLLELNVETALQINNNPGDMAVLADGIIVTIAEPLPVYTQLVLGTSINVFNKHWLHLNESGITLPHKIMDISNIKKFPARLLFRYEIKKEPGFSVSVL